MSVRSAEDPASGYFANERADVLGMLAPPAGRVLDVGCGAGATARILRDRGATSLTGIELVPEAAALARERFDEVLVGTVESVLPALEGSFDAFVCLDVLEHLADPEAVVAELRSRAAPGAQLLISVPNARHLSLVWDLVAHGTFGYTDWGHRDRTHLRWFTRRDIEALAERTGWHVVETRHAGLGRSRGLVRVGGRRVTEFVTGQWFVRAVAR
jgi:2-polyprenyl-3-methyl-5-hydroxy-6-metoxy-1,4-benzoquinol methylase